MKKNIMVDMSRISFDWLERRNELSPHKEALVDLHTGRRFTYRQFNQRANRLANGWRHAWGIKKGDRVGVLAKNCSECLEAIYAAAKLGAILVPINNRLVGEELIYIFNDCEPKGLVLGEDFLDVISDVKKDINVSHYCLLDGANAEGMTPYEDFLDSADDQTPKLEEPNTLDDPQIILYTSGTTGYPKGAITTHGNILFNSMINMLQGNMHPTNIFILSLPLFHTGGINVVATPTIHIGGTVVIMRSFDPGDALRLINEKIVNCVFFVATMWVLMYQHKDFHTTDFSELRIAMSGGESCPLPVLKAYQEKGIPLNQGYGLTESGPGGGTILSPEDAIRKVGSAGLTTFHTDLRIVNDDGIDVPQGEVGEIIMRGPTITPGYWNNPKATAEAIRNGWFYTGDLAEKDEDGYIYIRGRKKDMIISGGENIYPAEVERVLNQYPKIAQVAVFGVPHEKWGEAPHAVIAPKSGETITEEEVLDFLHGKLARFKIPKSFSFMESLPTSTTGKVLKRVLQESFLEN